MNLCSVTSSNILHKIDDDYFLVTIPDNNQRIKWGDWFYDNHGHIIQWTEEFQTENKFSNDLRYVYPKVVASTKTLEGITKIYLNDITKLNLPI